MLSIIDNVNLPSRGDRSFNPWLQTILEHLQGLGKETFVLRLTSERRPSSILYALENSRNKTLACLSKKGSTIRVEIFRREMPDPAQYLKPPLAPALASLFEDTAQGLLAAAEAICAVLGTPTAYSNKTVLKAKVFETPDPADPWALSGGRITRIDYEHDAVSITLQDASVHRLHQTQFLGTATPKLMKYLVIDNRRNAEVINESEFDFYFEMHHAHNPSPARAVHRDETQAAQCQPRPA